MTRIHFLKDLLKTPNRNIVVTDYSLQSRPKKILSKFVCHIRREDDNCQHQQVDSPHVLAEVPNSDELDQSGSSSDHVTCQLL